MDNIYLFPPDDNPPTKTCTGACGQTFPATAEYFHRFKHSKDGLKSRCKGCIHEDGKAYRARPEVREHKIAHDRAYYARPEIKAREQARGKARYARPEIKERTRIQTKAYRDRPEIKERNRANRKIYRSTTEYQERQQARVRAWQKTNYNHLRAYQKAYYHSPENIEATRERGRANSHKRRATKRSVKGTYNPQQIRDQLKRQKHKCYYCQKRLQTAKGKYTYHIEHTFPLNRVAGSDIPANDISYLVLACPACNLSKGDRFPWEFPEGGRLL